MGDPHQQGKGIVLLYGAVDMSGMLLCCPSVERKLGMSAALPRGLGCSHTCGCASTKELPSACSRLH